MALEWHQISFLVAARSLGASYERTLVMGRQDLFATAPEIVHAYQDAGEQLDLDSAEALVRQGQGYGEPLLRHLGARQADSLDASDYENSTIVHDLNDPLPESLRGRYTVVFDGGSLEHVFNVPQALRNCLTAVEPGGHFISITVTNGWSGHGFYQFSPELFYRVLTPENGFRVEALLVRSVDRWAKWLAVADPARVGGRVELASPWQTLIYVLARRVSDAEPLSSWPQQSDYRQVWTTREYDPPRRRASRLIRQLPPSIRGAVGTARASTAVLGRRSGPGHFRPVTMRDVAGGSLRDG